MTLVFFTKVGLVAGTVWLTNHLGVWDNSARSEDLYIEMKSQMEPQLEMLKKRYCPESKEDEKTWRESWIDAWNETVRHGFTAASQLPHYCERFSEDVQQSLNSLIYGDPENSKFHRLSSIMVFTRLAQWISATQIKDDFSLGTDMLELQLLSIHKQSSQAQQEYKNSLIKGFYFSHRMSDWKKSFVNETSHIINESLRKELEHIDDKQSRLIQSGVKTNPARIDQPKLPMIKNDVTCRKSEIA